MPRRCLLLLLDGLGDRTYAELNDRTPLQAAHTPNLDRIAARGANGLYHATLQGQPLPTENAHFVLFGYDLADFPGRGILEALGAGIAVCPGEVAILAHLAGVESHNGVAVLSADKTAVSETEAAALIAAIADFEAEELALHFHHTGGTFGVLHLKGDASALITDSNLMLEGLPLPDIVPLSAAAHDPAAQRTARMLRQYLRWSYRRLRDHPVNTQRRSRGAAALTCPVTQRAGSMGTIRPFARQNGLRGLSIASGIILRGLCTYIGMDFQPDTDSGDVTADYRKRLGQALARLPDYDFIHVHTKAADEAAHRKDPARKRDVIAAIDRAIGTHLPALLNDPELLLVVTADHSTPSSGPLIHAGEPVPIVFCGKGVRRDPITVYDEVSAAGGSLGTLRGEEFMYTVLNLLDRAKLRGIMDTPDDQPYFPGRYRPLRLD